jgi:hypothetical protein
LEEELVKYILLMEETFYGLTRNDLRRMAYALASRNGIKHPFGSALMAGSAWLDLFLQRHKNVLSLRRPYGTSFARASGFNKENFDKFFEILDEEYKKNQYPPDRVFNVVETGLTIV